MDHTIHWSLSLATIAATTLNSATIAGGADRVEFSDDGHASVAVRAERGAGEATITGAGVPYGTVPDWQNTLRRQVGGLQAEDMNGDGLIDLVVGCYISNSFPPYDDWHNMIYFNVGGELEAEPSWVSSDEVSTGDVQVADFNADGHPDIFSANGGVAMSDSVIYFGSASGPSTTPGWISNEPGNAWNNYALPVDIDNDGFIDVVTANQGNSQNDPYRPMFGFMNESGTLETAPSWQSAETSIQNFLAAADYDGNGWLDIAVSKWANFESGVYRNDSGELNTTPAWTTGTTTTDKGVAWSDVDDDGWPDLALGKNPTQLFTNNAGTLTLGWESQASFFGHSELAFVDVNGDGFEDLIEIHFSNRRTNIYLNNAGVLDHEPTWSYVADSVGTAIALGDLNGNGRLDLVIGTSGEPSLHVFYAEDLPTPCPGDLNGDQTVDVLDLLQVLSAWGACPECDEDLNRDDVVNVLDLLQLLSAWGACE